LSGHAGQATWPAPLKPALHTHWETSAVLPAGHETVWRVFAAHEAHAPHVKPVP
jgi:hypothetical protein